MKFVIKKEVGSVYWYDDGVLMYAPLNKYNTFDTENGGEVDFELMDDVPIKDTDRTFGDIYKQVKNILL